MAGNRACEAGLACSGNSPSNKTCQPVNVNPVSCTSNSDCKEEDGAYCECSPSVGESFCIGASIYNNPCTQQSLELITCLAENQCTIDSDAPGSCCMKNCKDQFNQANFL
jgi:hypothetical protein